MKKRFTFVATALALTVLAGSAAAQMTGNPVYATTYGTGITLAPDFARCTSNCTNGGNPTFIGVRALVSLPLIKFGVGVGQYNPDVTILGVEASKETTYQANLAFTVFGGPLIPVSVALHAGVGLSKIGSPTDPVLAGELKNFIVPIAVALSLNIPTPGFNLEPWIAPRIQISRQTADGFGLLSVVTETNLEFGFSAGVNGGLPMGLGFHAAIDFVQDSPFTAIDPAAVDQSIVTFGLGVHYTFGLPNAPMVPGI